MSELAVLEEKAVARQQVKETSVVGMSHNLAEIIELAKVMSASGFYTEVNTAQKAATIMLIGAQYGIPPAQSLTAIHIVKGKPMLHYSALLSKVRQHVDYDYDIVECSDKRAEIVFTRKGKECGRSVFTMADAKRQGTQNLDKYPDTMLLARAASNGIKRYCPDVLNGMPTYVPGEIEEDAAVYSTTTPGRKADAIRAEMQARAASVDTTGVDVFDPTFLESLGMDAPAESDWRAYCENHELDAADLEAKAQAAGVTTKEQLYHYAEFGEVPEGALL